MVFVRSSPEQPNFAANKQIHVFSAKKLRKAKLGHESHRQVALSEIKLKSAWLLQTGKKTSLMSYTQEKRNSVTNKSICPVFLYYCFCSFDRLNHLTQFRLLMDLVQFSYFLSFVPFDCFCRLQFFSLTI